MNEHLTSMAVWAVPSPVVAGEAFRVRVGVRCSTACGLGGRRVEVHDAEGHVVGQARLADIAWGDSEALFWAEVDLVAPVTAGVHQWAAAFRDGDIQSTHPETTAAFSFRATPAPDHRIRIRITEKDSGAPIPDVEVRLGPYQFFTDQMGEATTALAAGSYLLDIRRDGYTADPTTVRVAGDLTVRIDALPAPTHADMIARMERYEDVWGVTNWRARQLPIPGRPENA